MLRYGDERTADGYGHDVTLSDVAHKFLPMAFKAFETELPSARIYACSMNGPNAG